MFKVILQNGKEITCYGFEIYGNSYKLYDAGAWGKNIFVTTSNIKEIVYDGRVVVK